MKTIIPIEEKIVWKQYAQCDDVQRAWIAVAAARGRPAGQNPFGIPICEFTGNYRLCIEGELQPIRKYSATAPATHSDDDLRVRVLARAIADLSGCSEDLECWHWKIVSSSPTFLADVKDAVKEQCASYFDVPMGRTMSLNQLRMVTLTQVMPEDETQIWKDEDIKIY